MTSTNISEFVTKVFRRALQSGRLAVLLIAGTIASTMPAHAQSGDTWKSIAIIGGSTAAGAIIGHKVAGSKGAYIGAAVGAAGGYAIDRRRRQNNEDRYNSNEYPYDNGGYYGNDPYYGDGGYYGGADAYPYPNGYQNSNNYANTRSHRRR